MTAAPIEPDAGGELDRVVASVERSHERVEIVRDGEVVAVMIDPRELAGLEDTAAFLESPIESTWLDEGIADLDKGHTFSSAEILARYGRGG